MTLDVSRGHEHGFWGLERTSVLYLMCRGQRRKHRLCLFRGERKPNEGGMVTRAIDRNLWRGHVGARLHAVPRPRGREDGPRPSSARQSFGQWQGSCGSV